MINLDAVLYNVKGSLYTVKQMKKESQHKKHEKKKAAVRHPY